MTHSRDEMTSNGVNQYSLHRSQEMYLVRHLLRKEIGTSLMHLWNNNRENVNNVRVSLLFSLVFPDVGLYIDITINDQEV